MSIVEISSLKIIYERSFLIKKERRMFDLSDKKIKEVSYEPNYNFHNRDYTYSIIKHI